MRQVQLLSGLLKTMTNLEFCSDLAPHNIDFLRGLKPSELDLILAAGRLRQFSAKSVMTRQGEPAGRLLLLCRGQARYFIETQCGKKLNLRPITPGLIFGGAALVSANSTYLASSETVQNSTVLIWEGATIRAFAKRFHQILENALFLALDHFSWYLSAYASQSSQTAKERLAQVLAQLAPAIGKKVLGGTEINLTNEELANSANITPFTASRMVSQWKRIGALRKQRGKIVLTSPERLFLRIV